MDAPDLTILMPMLNVGRFVREAAGSVLASTGVKAELVIIDDGSTDDSRSIVKSIGDPRIRLIDGPRTGIANAFNAGLNVARGRWLARCDGDDLVPPQRFASQMRWLEQNPEFGAACGGFATITERGRFIRDMNCGPTAQDITDELHTGHTRTSFCTWLIRTDLVRQAGGCRDYFKVAEDIDLQLRMSELCRVWYDPESCYRYRLHGTSATHTCSTALRKFYHATACRLQTQRLAGQPDDLAQGQPPPLPMNGDQTVFTADHHTQRVLIGAAWEQHGAGRRGLALRLALRACLAHPTNFRAWKSLGALALRGPQP